MNTRCSRFTRAVLLLLAGMAASLVWQSASAQALPAIEASRAVVNLIVPIAGTVQADLETVAFSGRAHIMSTLATDPDFGGLPSVILSIDLLNVFGVGQTTGARYVATGEDKVLRLLRPSDLVEVTFPVFPLGSKTALARPLLASFSLNFDLGNGQLRRAIAKFSTPDFPGRGLGR